jgi:hypothetical protein
MFTEVMKMVGCNFADYKSAERFTLEDVYDKFVESERERLSELNKSNEECKCFRFTGSNSEYQTYLCPIHKTK